MTWLLRKIDELDPWLKLAETDDLAAVAANPPLWAIRLFIPSPRDEGSLSLYEVDDENGAKRVAAAWGFTIGDIDKVATNKVSFIAASRASIEAAGFIIENSPGELNHATDDQHRGISPADLEQAKALAGLFIEGELFPFEGKTVQIAATEEARTEQFKFGLIAKRGGGNTAAKNVLKLVGNDVIWVRGGTAQ
jgi:hypothetical protein